MYKYVGLFVVKFLGLFNKVKVYNKHHLPKEGGYVIACTHTGWIDVLNLGVALYPKPIHYMAKKQLFEGKFLGWFLPKMNAFPVDREHPGPSVIKVPSQLIAKGEVVGIFPSGTRSVETANLKQGAVTIAQLSKAPIIPAAYIGPYNPKEVFARKKGYILFGEPIHIAVKGKDGREQYTEVLEQTLHRLQTELQNKIAESE